MARTERIGNAAPLPTGWRWVALGEVVRNVNATEPDPLAAGVERFVGLEHLDSDSLQIKRWGLVRDGTTFTRKFVKGQVLFGKRRAYQRKAAVAKFDGVCSGDLLVFGAKEDLLPELLPFVVTTDGFFQHALRTSAGSLSPRTKWRELAKYEFALPPKGEQLRISQVLAGFEDVMTRFELVRLRLEETERALSIRTFHDHQHSTRKLGDVLDHASDGPFGSKLKTEHYAASGARVVRLQNIGHGELIDVDKAYVSLDYFEELRKYALAPGDVLVAGLGDESVRVGRACEVPKGLGPAVHKADCFCLRPAKDLISASYLRHYLNSQIGQHQILSRAQGTTRLRINVTNLKSISVPVPDQREQQRVERIFLQLEDQFRRLAGHQRSIRTLYRRSQESLLLNGRGGANYV